MLKRASLLTTLFLLLCSQLLVAACDVRCAALEAGAGCDARQVFSSPCHSTSRTVPSSEPRIEKVTHCRHAACGSDEWFTAQERAPLAGRVVSNPRGVPSNLSPTMLHIPGEIHGLSPLTVTAIPGRSVPFIARPASSLRL